MHHDGMLFYPLPLGVGGFRARAARDEPRVPRRRAAASRRPPDLERGEGAESAGLGRRVGDRGAPAGSGWEVVRPSRYARRITAYTPCAISGPAAGLRCDEDRVRSVRPRGARHLQRLRERLHAVGDLSHLRGELELQLRERRRDLARAAALRHRQGARLRLGDGRRALRRRAPSERAEPLRLGGRDRSVRAAIEAGEAHRARPDQARGRAPVGRRRPADRLLHGRRRGLRVHLQVRDRARVGSGEPRGEPRSPRRRRALRRAVQRRRHRRLARARAREERPHRGERLREPGRRAGEDAPVGGPRGRDADGPPRVGRGAPGRRARCT